MIAYLENHKESTTKHLVLINNFSKVSRYNRYTKINFYTSTKHLEIKTRSTLPFELTQKYGEGEGVFCFVFPGKKNQLCTH